MTKEEREALADKMARHICIASGMDPDKEIGVGDGVGEYYASERVAYYGGTFYEPQFVLFRRVAMDHILAREAYDACAL